MIVHGVLLADELSSLYERPGPDPDFGRIVERFQIQTDDELADLIDADGRLRLRLKRPVTLGRYLAAVPDLPARSEPLDAAIDMALRALARTGRADEQSIEEFIAAFPEIGSSIREAAALSNAVWSTARVRTHLGRSPFRELPTDFGPLLESGVHRYELKELLGDGAFGAVYLAVDRRLSEEDHPALVSIKVLPGDDRSERTRQQLVEEATKARRIDHPNVARVLDRGVSDQNQEYVVYELVDGGDLGKWVRRRTGALDIERAVELTAKVARGVHAAHMAGLVHCDLKPNNILVSADGEPKVTDFGIAIREEDLASGSALQECESAPIGNLAFMSPEQYRMELGAMTIPTDVYALGGVLYWLLTGVLPNGSTPEAICRTHDDQTGRREPPSLREHRSSVDGDLEAICQRAMAVRSQDRFSSAAELAESLEAWRGREPIAWRHPSLLRKAILWVRRKPALAASSFAIVVLLVASVAGLQHLAVQAAVAEAYAEEEERQRDNFRANLRNFIAQLRESRAKGLSDELLPQMWVAEWLFGPTVLGEGQERFELWEVRIEVVRDLVEEAKAAGGPGYFYTLVWESALAFWLIKSGEPREAETLLAENHARWQAVLDPDDPWLAHLEAMRACAAIVGLPDSVPLGKARGGLAGIAATLERAKGQLDGESAGSPLHRLVLESLLRLYGPGLLDRPQLAEQVAQALQELSE